MINIATLKGKGTFIKITGALFVVSLRSYGENPQSIKLIRIAIKIM
jgi:hypothetical protein